MKRVNIENEVSHIMECVEFFDNGFRDFALTELKYIFDNYGDEIQEYLENQADEEEKEIIEMALEILKGDDNE